MLSKKNPLVRCDMKQVRDRIQMSVSHRYGGCCEDSDLNFVNDDSMDFPAAIEGPA